MIRSYLQTAWKNFYKHKFYTAINVFGLALGISCTVILYLFISYHLSFDNYHPNAKNTYRIVTDLHLPDGSVEYEQGAPLILGQTLAEQMPGITNEAVLLNKRTFTVATQKNSHTAERFFYDNENVAFADGNWFKLFTYNFKAGNPNTALQQVNTAVITSALAQKYFNTDDVVGNTLRLDNKHIVTITGVLQDVPPNTDFQAQLFISLASVKGMYPDIDTPLHTYWGFISSKNNVFVSLAQGTSTNNVNQKIKALTKQALNADASVFQFHLQPLSDVHFNGRYSGTVSKPLLLILGLVGVALVLIACVNFVNMATAQSFTRAKEIGTRKVLGSSKKGIFWQFITETAYVVLAAAILALSVTWLLLPKLNNWLQLPLAINSEALFFLFLLLAVIVFASGFYPAVILSGFKPVNALKNVVSSSNPASRILRSMLIVGQNAVAQMLIVCTVIIALQVNFLKNADLGFNKDAVVMLPVPANSPANAVYLRSQLANSAAVKSVSLCYRAPASTSGKGGTIRYDNNPWEKFAVRSIIGDENYVKTFGLQLLAGKNLSGKDGAHEYLVNQQVLVKLSIKTPGAAIGHRLIAGDFNDEEGIIVGVVKDFKSHSLYTQVDPVLIVANPGYYEYAAVKMAGGADGNIINALKQTWQQVYPKNVFDYHFLDQQIASFYQKEEMISKLIQASTMVAILISCLGMTGLISLITVQRTKEVGIRKVLGASVVSIVGLLTRDFIKLVAIAVIISAPFAWWAMHDWLQGFAFRIDIKWWVFGLSAITALLVAFITVALQSVKAASSNPVKSIRNS